MKRYSPMLLEKAPAPFDSELHSFEIKYDGFRVLLYVSRAGTRLVSRAGNDLTSRFPEIGDLWSRFHKPTVLDGELVVLDEAGLPRFDALQSRFRSRASELAATVVAFDVLHYGRAVIDRPLERRQKMLAALVPTADPELMRSVPIIGEGRALFSRLSALHIEGMVAKVLSSTYEQRRSRNWLKIYTPYGRSVLRERLANVPRRRS